MKETVTRPSVRCMSLTRLEIYTSVGCALSQALFTNIILGFPQPLRKPSCKQAGTYGVGVCRGENRRSVLNYLLCSILECV